MKPAKLELLISLSFLFAVCTPLAHSDEQATKDYERARWDAIHFKPAIDRASNEQCLNCHQEILERRVLKQSPAGVKASDTLAWYQTLDSYEGEQDTFHRRHLVSPLSTRLMNLKCNTCHQGHDPREEAPVPATENDAGGLVFQ